MNAIEQMGHKYRFALHAVYYKEYYVLDSLHSLAYFCNFKFLINAWKMQINATTVILTFIKQWIFKRLEGI